MHLYLTDRLTCPRCGPDFGLLLLARRVEDRRVFEGELGCSNCRESYPVTSGVGDLRPPPRSPRPLPPRSDGQGPADQGVMDPTETVRLGALMGVAEGPGTLFMKGPAARHARGLAELISQVEVVAVDPAVEAEPETPGVSRFVIGARIPFYSASFRGVLLDGTMRPEELEEAARVVAPSGRLVVLRSTGQTAHALESMGLSVILEEGDVVVAEKERGESAPLIPLRAP